MARPYHGGVVYLKLIKNNFYQNVVTGVIDVNDVIWNKKNNRKETLEVK